MKMRILPYVALAVSLFGFVHAAEFPEPKRVQPVKIIFDTDMGNDVDDALALALIHALQNRAACELLAVTLTNPDPQAGVFVDALNTFYGRSAIPIGINPQSPTVRVSPFLKVAAFTEKDGRKQHPADFDPAQAPTALALLRSTLAAAKDNSVVIVQVGFFTNLAALLDSPADAIDARTGLELIKAKVKHVSLMGGAFQVVRGTNYFLEYNVKWDIPAAIKVAERWPTPMVWNGAELGEAVMFPAVTVDDDFGYVPAHPVYQAYQLFRPTPHERFCYDLISVIEAVWPARGYFNYSVPGRVEVLPDSFTKFVPEKKGRDRFLTIDAQQTLRLRELFAAMISEAPISR